MGGANTRDDDPRAYPRINVRGVTAELVLADSKRLTVDVDDISPDGIQIRCDVNAAKQLHPSDKTSPEDVPPLFVKIGLPLPGGVSDLLTESRIIHFAIMSGGDDVAFGLKFLKFVGTGKQDLDRFIAQALEPGSEA